MSEPSKRSWWLRFTPLAFFRRDLLLRERRALAKRDPQTNLFYDPIEDDSGVQPLLAAADVLAESAAPDYGIGSCWRFWDAKRRILGRRFGIEWFSPADMNPSVDFD